MAQEFTINSTAIESKINQLLPSQGGFGAGVDFSASTMVIPIVDLTETAEGSDTRQDLQTSISFGSATVFDTENTTSVIINTTGYYRIYGTTSGATYSGVEFAAFRMSDGLSTKDIQKFYYRNTSAGANGQVLSNIFDFNVFLPAGHSISALSTATGIYISGSTRQIADIDGNLVNPI